MENLLTAEHYCHSRPAPRYDWQVFKTVGLRPASLGNAVLEFVGMQPREFSAVATGKPEMVFGFLSAFAGFGEIVWVDEWPDFSMKLPKTTAGEVLVPRRRVTQTALRAIHAAGGCLIKAGPNRYLVAKVSEKEDYTAAIRALGWLDGTPPPWAAGNRNPRPGADRGGTAHGSQPIGSDTNRAPTPAGHR